MELQRLVTIFIVFEWRIVTIFSFLLRSQWSAFVIDGVPMGRYRKLRGISPPKFRWVLHSAFKSRLT